jgi:hypothetical protein
VKNKIEKVADKFKKLPKAAKVKTVATKISWQEFVEKEKFSDETKKQVSALVKFFESTTKWKCVMWGKIFGFGNWEYISEKTGRNGIWPATAFAVRSNGIVIYTMMGHKSYPGFLKDLGKYKDAGKSCLQIKKIEDINLKVLEKLIKQSLVDLKKKYTVK